MNLVQGDVHSNYFLIFITRIWLSFRRDFGVDFALSPGHNKSYPFLCAYISNFHFVQTIPVGADDHCSSPKSLSGCAPHDYIL